MGDVKFEVETGRGYFADDRNSVPDLVKAKVIATRSDGYRFSLCEFEEMPSIVAALVARLTGPTAEEERAAGGWARRWHALARALSRRVRVWRLEAEGLDAELDTWKGEAVDQEDRAEIAEHGLLLARARIRELETALREAALASLVPAVAPPRSENRANPGPTGRNR